MNSWETDICLLPPCCLCLRSPSAMEELGFPRFFSFPSSHYVHLEALLPCQSVLLWLTIFQMFYIQPVRSLRVKFVQIQSCKEVMIFCCIQVEVVGRKLWERLGFSFQWLKAALQCKGPSPKLKRWPSGSLGWWHIVSSSRNPSTALAYLSFCSLALCSLIYYKIFHLHCEMNYSKKWWKLKPNVISGQKECF